MFICQKDKPMNIRHHKIIITGGASGIGKALTEEFLKHDNQIIVVSRDIAKLNHIKQKNVETYTCDLTQDTERNQFVEWIKKEHPDTNVLINNAGVQYNYNVLEEGHFKEKIIKELKINLETPLLLIASLLPIIRKNNNPTIINVSSALARVPKKSAVVYSASKAGIQIFSEAFRLQQKDVKVFDVIPPLVETAMTAGREEKKVTPQQVAKALLSSMSRDEMKVLVGKVKLLYHLHRLWPCLAIRIMNRN